MFEQDSVESELKRICPEPEEIPILMEGKTPSLPYIHTHIYMYKIVDVYMSYKTCLPSQHH